MGKVYKSFSHLNIPEEDIRRMYSEMMMSRLHHSKKNKKKKTFSKEFMKFRAKNLQLAVADDKAEFVFTAF